MASRLPIQQAVFTESGEIDKILRESGRGRKSAIPAAFSSCGLATPGTLEPLGYGVSLLRGGERLTDGKVRKDLAGNTWAERIMPKIDSLHFKEAGLKVENSG
jgi:hypothetical protein